MEGATWYSAVLVKTLQSGGLSLPSMKVMVMMESSALISLRGAVIFLCTLADGESVEEKMHLYIKRKKIRKIFSRLYNIQNESCHLSCC